MKKYLLFAALAIVGVVLLSATPAQAALVRLQLTPAGGTQMAAGPDPTAAARDSLFGGLATDIWDLRASSANTTQTYSNLLETSTGLSSGLSFTTRPGNGVENPSGTTPGGKLIIGAQYMFHGETFTISGLQAGQEVRLIGYGLSNRNWGMNFSNTGTNPATTNVSGLVGNHYNLTPDSSWVELTVTPVGTSLNGTWDQGPEEGGGRVHVMALQIYQADPVSVVPEPAGLGLIGAALLLLKRRRS